MASSNVPPEPDEPAQQPESERPDIPGPPPMPGWVKAFLIGALVLALLVAVLLASGHGPRLHSPAAAFLPASSLVIRIN